MIDHRIGVKTEKKSWSQDGPDEMMQRSRCFPLLNASCARAGQEGRARRDGFTNP